MIKSFILGLVQKLTYNFYLTQYQLSIHKIGILYNDIVNYMELTY